MLRSELETLREEYRGKQDMIVNVPERSVEMEQLKQNVDKLEANNEALLTVLQEALQKDDAPPPRKRSICFVDPNDTGRQR
jgi:uncharacterized protein involved in exopolysaccharide biosynthesis